MRRLLHWLVACCVLSTVACDARPPAKPTSVPIPIPSNLEVSEAAKKDTSTVEATEARKRPHIILTPSAEKEVTRLIKAEDGPEEHLKVWVDESFRIQFRLATRFDTPEDESFFCGWPMVAIDPKSALRIPLETTIDFIEVKGKKGFCVLPPNVSNFEPELNVKLG
ncbi:MAG: hypothetical protein K2X38_23985 [Gemmataceae bacterium]|nr:hypothetical protein [Gemmataceae bacterium]